MNTLRKAAERVISEYDAQGWHRSGTKVDADSAQWLADQARSLGMSPRLDSFSFERVIPGESFIELKGERIDGFPIFDGAFSDENGVRGSLGHPGDEADIAVLKFPPSGLSEQLREANTLGRHAAIVGTVDSDPPGMAIRNAESFSAPLTIPVLQVSNVAADRLANAADAGLQARLVAQAETENAEAHNVVVEIAGSETGLRPLVVMTPRSGWFHCAAERGGGIFCWLEIMRAFRDRIPKRDVIMIATSGHELGHLGLKSFLKSNPELPTSAAAWLHLGASIGASQNWKPRLQTSDAELESRGVEYLRGQPFDNLSIVPTGQAVGGEAREIHANGGRFVSIVGHHSLFHLEADRWPDAVDVEALSAYANALRNLARSMSS